MSQILNKVRDVDPNNGDAVKDALSGFFQNLSKHTEVDCIRWLSALENTINRFPKYCMSHRNTAETYLVNFLDSKNYFYVIEAAKCAHALQQVRPPHEKAATAKSCWRDQMKALCNSVHLLLSHIFPNFVDLYNGPENEEPQSMHSPLLSALTNLNTINNAGRNVEKQTILCSRLRNVFVFIQAMLVEVYPVAKPVQPQTILEALLRSLSVAPGKESTIDITTIKIQALRTVDALIACLGANLIPFSALVIRFVMQTLKWTSENSSNESSKVRCQAYNTLSRWLGVLHAHRSTNDRGRCWQDELAKHVTDDVTPDKHVVQLTMSTQPTKNLSKKARKRLANSMLQGSSIASHMPGEKNKVVVSEETNDEVAIAALDCAETFLTVCGIFLKPTTHKQFQERLVRECYALEAYSSERALALLRALEATRKTSPSTVPPPTQYCLQLYSVLVNSQQREFALLRALEATRKSSPSTVPPYCLQLYSVLMNSQQREISKFCSQALLDIRLHLHCSPPSINFAMEITDKQNKAEAKKAIMVEKNKAALDALLGHRESSENSNDVITIQDEPLNKKPRLDEDVSDKISVSSDSVRSVEISDDSEGEVELVQENEIGNDENNRMNEDTVAIDLDKSSENEIQANSRSKNNETLKTVQISDVVDSVDKTIHSVVNTMSNVNLNSTQNTNNTPVSRDDREKDNIYEAKTQLPINASNETIEEEMPSSIEIAYDLPNTGKEVPVLEKMDDENLPSTNETDDIQITCGQVVNSSQDERDKAKDNETPKLNGSKSPDKIMEIDDKVTEITVKITGANETVTVDDMLADFVDEVNE